MSVSTPKTNPGYMADHIRRVLKDGGSAAHAQEVQRFFQEEVQSRGWYTAELRRVAVDYRRSILMEMGQDFLVKVADDLFSGDVLENKVFAVCLLETLAEGLGDAEFQLVQKWLERISSWADHDAVVHYLIASMIRARPARARVVFRWAKSPDRWHRRAACVALIQGTRKKMFFPEITRLSGALLSEEDEIVQKGLGWLLRETTKYNTRRAVPYLKKIRKVAPRLVLRTACETLPAAVKQSVLETNQSKLRQPRRVLSSSISPKR
jgi:3-methyladenine DNA glycosylase AlkD